MHAHSQNYYHTGLRTVQCNHIYKTYTFGPPHNKMKINYSKTKEMILGPLAKSPPDLLSAPSSADLHSGIERVKHFKLLGINISHDFSWQTHVDVITSKAATRLYFLKILKKIWFEPTTSPPFLLICHPPSVGVLFSGLASQSLQDSV